MFKSIQYKLQNYNFSFMKNTLLITFAHLWFYDCTACLVTRQKKTGTDRVADTRFIGYWLLVIGRPLTINH